MRNKVSVAVVFALLCADSHGGETYGTAKCKANGNRVNSCELEFIALDMNHTVNRVERINISTGVWESALDNYEPITPTYLETGHLYRVVSCDGNDSSNACHITKTFWAPVFKSQENMPEVVAISGIHGGFVDARISKNSPLSSQLRQLNVYLITDLVKKFRGKGFGEMLQPVSKDGYSCAPEVYDPSDDHYLIHSDVYENYKGMRTGLLITSHLFD